MKPLQVLVCEMHYLNSTCDVAMLVTLNILIYVNNMLFQSGALLKLAT